jgi:hypothetical protein
LNLRPSGYEPDELPGCSTPRGLGWCGGDGVWGLVGGPGGDLLSHVLRRSTMGAAGFHGRVRNGSGGAPALSATRSNNQPRLPPTRSATWRGPLGRSADEPRSGGTTAWRCRRAGGGLGACCRQVGMGRLGMRLSLLGVEVVRAIRTGQLSASPRLHIRPIDVVVYHGSDGETWFCGRFPA